MNKSEIFKAAHKMTKQVKRAKDSYSVTFAACLKAAHELAVEAAKVTGLAAEFSKKNTMNVVFYMGNDFVAEVGLDKVGFYSLASMQSAKWIKKQQEVAADSISAILTKIGVYTRPAKVAKCKYTGVWVKA